MLNIKNNRLEMDHLVERADHKLPPSTVEKTPGNGEGPPTTEATPVQVKSHDNTKKDDAIAPPTPDLNDKDH